MLSIFLALLVILPLVSDKIMFLLWTAPGSFLPFSLFINICLSIFTVCVLFSRLVCLYFETGRSRSSSASQSAMSALGARFEIERSHLKLLIYLKLNAKLKINLNFK